MSADGKHYSPPAEVCLDAVKCESSPNAEDNGSFFSFTVTDSVSDLKGLPFFVFLILFFFFKDDCRCPVVFSQMLLLHTNLIALETKFYFNNFKCAKYNFY